MKSNILFDRQRFVEILNFYKQHGLTPQTAQLRFEVPIQAGRGHYEIQVNREGIIASRSTEKRLPRNDAFVTKGLGVFLMVEDVTKPGSAPLLSYPLLQSDALPPGYKGFTTADVEAFYNGSIEILTGSKADFEGIPLRRFRNVPQTQPAENAGDSIGLLPEFNSDDMILNLAERFTFAGTRDQKIRIDFPYTPAMDFSTPEGTQAFIVVVADGWLVKDGTNHIFRDADNPIGMAI